MLKIIGLCLWDAYCTMQLTPLRGQGQLIHRQQTPGAVQLYAYCAYLRTRCFRLMLKLEVCWVSIY